MQFPLRVLSACVAALVVTGAAAKSSDSPNSPLVLAPTIAGGAPRAEAPADRPGDALRLRLDPGEALLAPTLSRRGAIMTLAALGETRTDAGRAAEPAAQPTEGLPAALKRLLAEHPLAKAAANNVAAARENIGSERSGWFPRLSLRTSTGNERIDRDAATSGKFRPKDATLSANQLLWDFGAINAAIASADSNLGKEERENSGQLSNLLLAGIEAHLRLLRAQRLLSHARQSEDNVKRQTQLENTRMELGKGYTTDLLQAKAQLAGAQARRVAAEGATETARNRYRAVFGENALPAEPLAVVGEPTATLPKNLDEILGLVDSSHPDLLTARARAEVAEAQQLATSRKEWMPRIDLQAEKSHRRDVDGLEGARTDTRLLLQANWNFDTGLRASHASSAAAYAAAAEKERADYAALQAREEARNAWSDYHTARQRLDYLRNQVDISRRFLDLARQERELGRRSLLDVLSGETNLINAQGDAAAAETDVALAAYRVLRAVGRLDVNAVSITTAAR